MKITKRRAFLMTLGMILFFAFLYYALFIRMVWVPTGAMKNTILPGDRLAVHVLMGEIRRGDIVMFKFPQDPSTRFVKRVIGLPGETIEYRNQRVYINGSELAERRVRAEPQEPDDLSPMEVVSSEGEGSYTVCYYAIDYDDIDFAAEAGEFAVREPFEIPPDSYFVMGDNRDNSLDSRFWGVVQRNLILGKPFLVYWSEDMANHKTRWNRMFTRLK